MEIKKELNMPSVSVVIVNYNHENYLEDLLNSVLATKYPNFRIVLIDSASTDKSTEIIKTFNDKRLKKIFLSENLSLCEERNMGANYEQSCYYAFLDSDVAVSPMWLQRLVDSMESDPTVGIAESNIISPVPWAASSSERIKLYALAAAFIVRNKVWRQLGGFDEEYFIGYEDQDLGWRTWLLGYKVIGVLDSVVYHVGGGSPLKGRRNRYIRYHDFKNRISSLIKNLELYSFLYQTPRLFLVLAAFLIENFEKKQTDGISAVFWLLTNMPRLLQKRFLIQKLRKVKDKDIAPLWDTSVRGSLRSNGIFLG